MTAAEHAATIRAALAALNAALDAGAKAGVGSIIRVDVLASGSPEVSQRISVTVFARL